MLLSNSKDTIELKVIGYEYPDIQNNASSTEFNYDANWLNLYCAKDIGNKHNVGIEPCIMTTDIVRLLKLLEEYKEKRIKRIEFGGMEPNLELYLTRKYKKNILKIRFWCERSGEECKNLKCFKKKISTEEIQMIYDFFTEALEKFPIR